LQFWLQLASSILVRACSLPSGDAVNPAVVTDEGSCYVSDRAAYNDAS
jgi:hypothetical protein